MKFIKNVILAFLLLTMLMVVVQFWYVGLGLTAIILAYYFAKIVNKIRGEFNG